jgi:hypothetical protein
MAVMVTTDLLSTIAKMGLATLRESIQLIKRTNREYEKDISATTKGSTVNVVVPAPITAVAVTPGGVHPNDTVAVTPTIVPITLDQWYRAAFAFTDKQAAQVDRGIVPMQIQEAIRGLVNKVEANVWLNYKKFYGYVGTAGTTPFATDLSTFLAAEKLANDQLMPVDRRVLIMDTAANANFKGLRRTFDKNFQDIGVDAVWSPFVPAHVAGTNSGSDINGAHATVGVKTLTVHGGALGDFHVGDVFTIAGDAQTYTVTSQVGDGTPSSLGIEPGLKIALNGGEVITLKASHAVNLLMHPNAIAFAMAPMQAGANIAGSGTQEATVVDQDSGLALRLTYFRQFYQDEWSFDALWGSAVPRPELGVRIAG